MPNLISVCKEDTEKKLSFLNFRFFDHRMELTILWSQDLDQANTHSMDSLPDDAGKTQLLRQRVENMPVCMVLDLGYPFNLSLLTNCRVFSRA